MDTDTAVRGPGRMAFQDRVVATLDPALSADAAEVIVTMSDETRHVHRIEHRIGSAARPMTEAELEVKFGGMSTPVLGERRTLALMERCWDLTNLSDAGELARAAA